MSARNRLVWNTILPIDDALLDDEPNALDEHLERQLARLEVLGTPAADDDGDAWDDSAEDFGDLLDPMRGGIRGNRYS